MSLWCFKEWALVCEALAAGAQSLLWRKGGLAEGRHGFAFEHPSFLLFPTWYHKDWDKVNFTPQRALPLQSPRKIELRYSVSIEEALFLTDYNHLERLKPLHCLENSLLQERWSYPAKKKEKESESVPGIHVAFVRLYRLTTPMILDMEKVGCYFKGCRSWVKLPKQLGPLPELEPLLTEALYQKKRNCWDAAKSSLEKKLHFFAEDAGFSQ